MYLAGKKIRVYNGVNVYRRNSMEFFPAPDFGSDDEDEPLTPAQLPGVPVERPFFAFQDRLFDTPCPISLAYDSQHPVYATSSCHVFIARTVHDPPSFYALKSSTYVSRIRREFNTYQHLGDHPTIVKCYDMWMSHGSAFLQLELAERGSIRRELFEYSRSQIWTIFSHVITALAFLHGQGLMHLDVSPANILETSKGVFKLADFGTALRIGEFTEDCEGAGPYVSPEALAFPGGAHPVGAATDVFSFGVVMMELVGKKLAPRGSSPGYTNLRRGEYDLGFIDPEFDFVRQMLDPDPGKRPTSGELAQMERVKEEMEKCQNMEDVIDEPVVLKTPTAPTVRRPPETPYLKKYSGGRRIMFDDEF